MAVVKQFSCPQCNAEGKIALKGNDFEYRDIECCPVCGSALFNDDDDLIDFE